VDIDSMTDEYLEDMGWTLEEAIPTPEVLARLGLDDLIEDFWGQE